jgi:HlyD family secretion protein
VRISRTDVKQAEIRQKEAESQLGRIRELLPAGVASPEELETAQLALARAKADRARALQAVNQARSGLDKAEEDLAKTTLYAPLSGVVIALNAEVGEVVVSGTMNNAGSVIGTIADLSEVIAEVEVDETDIVHVNVDNPAIVKVDALPDEELDGKVIELGSSGVRKQGQEITVFKVKVLLTALDERIRPGMSARAHIEVAKHANAVVIPIEAVVKRKKEEDEEGDDTGAGEEVGKEKKEAEDEEDEVKVVFIVDEDEVARRREVETGLSDDTHVEILAGLEGGEQVVTGPRRVLKKLEDGDSLKPTDPEEEEKKKKESEDEEEDS